MSIVAAFMVPHPPLIVPNVGKGEEEKIRTTIDSYDAIAKRIGELKPDTIVISSPHAPMYGDYFNISSGVGAVGSFADFRAPEVTFDERYDVEFVRTITDMARDKGFPAGILGKQDGSLDHGVMVPLYFIRKYLSSFNLVRIGLSGLDLTMHYELGIMIKKAAEDLNRKVVYVASGDLSHKLKDYGPYGYSPEGPEYDKRIMEVCGSGEFDKLFDFDETFCDKAAECGHRSFVMMAGALDGMSLDIKEYSHEDVTGVGYGICSFDVKGEDPDRKFLDIYRDNKIKVLDRARANEDAYVKLARLSAEYYVKSGSELPRSEWPTLPDEILNQRAGAFVSIHENGRLRGCIGTILPVRSSLAEEIVRNAISASTEDPRFDPIRKEELPWLEINVDVLGTPEPIDSEDKLDVKRYGVIVTSDGRRGLLLPDLDGVDTVEQQISIASRKAGIRPGEPISLERFTVTRHI
ncbi:MAG: AmmeMemoRadiSam system protein A [Lachnospiraceae bacterium]|nr:AmmeMemoRadiSam system protein A [Lachnospiraceae bacterium]